MQLGVFLVLRGWLGYVIRTLISGKYKCKILLGRCEASWGEPERDMTVSTRLSDSVFTETRGLENALKSEYE